MKFFMLLLLFAACVVAAFFFPLAVVWALNVLFDLSIAYTFKTWVAIAVLLIVFHRPYWPKD